ncbi:unnamed protein product, partial [Mycena citricolor]
VTTSSRKYRHVHPAAMSSRISIARPQSSSYNSDPHGLSNSRSSSTGYRSANPDDPLEKLKAQARQVEDYVEIYSQPLKPHLPTIGRFLIVVTFLEDALRILTQWGDQIWYLQQHRKFPWGISHIFLLINVFTMLGASSMIILKRFTEFAAAGLLGVVIIQGFGYGLIFDLNFFLRNLSVIGGLSWSSVTPSSTARRPLLASPVSARRTAGNSAFLLAGRVLLIFLFLGFIIQGTWSIARVFVSLFGLAACIMVAVGFKAKWSAAFLVVVLSIFNVFANNWWSVHSKHPSGTSSSIYDFFQTLSIVGGLILLVNMGPGGLSVDEKKRLTKWYGERSATWRAQYTHVVRWLHSMQNEADAI